MRRALMAALAGATVLAGAACDSGKSDPAAAPATTVPAPSLSPSPDYSANTKLVCGRLQTIFDRDLPGIGTAIGKMITYKGEKQAAEAKKAENAAATALASAATKIRKETAAADDPEFLRAGATSAAKMLASAKNRKYFARVKTIKDFNGTIESQYAQWLTPVAGYCPAPDTSPSAGGAPSASSSASDVPTAPASAGAASPQTSASAG